MTRIDIENLSKSFDRHPALAGLDLSIATGELVSLLGPSGCGKSTTLRLIAGLDRPDTGTIRFDRRDISDQPVRARNVGMVFQRYALFSHMNVRRNIGFGLRVRAMDGETIARRVDDMLQTVQLNGLGERFPHQLSGGQMQRVALARTLVTDPALLMLDEPFAALDADLRVHMRGFVRALQQKLGMTTIFVTHDQAEAMEISDRIALMRAGRVVQYDTPEAIYHRPASPEIAAMIGAPNVLTGTVIACREQESAAYRGQESSRLGMQFGFGPLPLRQAAGYRPGEKIQVMIRPEIIDIAPAPAQETDMHILESVFMGGSIRYKVAAGPAVLRVDALSTRRLPAGQAVRLTIDPDHVWVFPRPSPDALDTRSDGKNAEKS